MRYLCRTIDSVTMKRTLIIILSFLALASFSPIDAGAQAKITTKKLKISDFTARITKVVLKGNDLTDGALREEVSARWRISPFEFCTVEEYNKLKNDPNYYFLMTATTTDKKYQGLTVLTLVKGGLETTDDPDKRSIEVACLPLCSTQYPSGREMVMMPALLDIIQDYVTKAMRSDKNGYSGFDIYKNNIKKTGHKSLYISEDDLAPETEVSDFDMDTFVLDEDEVDDIFISGKYNSIVTYCVAPSEPQKGSWSYQMVIDSETHQLLYYSKHKITDTVWAGFTKKDIRQITEPRKKYKK